MDLKIVFEDKHLLVLDKPAGLMVEKDQYGNPCLASLAEKYILKKENPKNLIIQNIHRLDRPVSGVIVFAKRKSVLKNLSEQFAGREMEKFYLAITDTRPDIQDGTLVHWLKKDFLNKKAIVFDKQSEEMARVELKFRILAEKEGKFLWKIKLITGKYHQIRAQLAFTGCPILGDEKYGSTVFYRPNEIALHAWKLKVNYPEDKTSLFVADPPESAPWSLFNKLTIGS